MQIEPNENASKRRCPSQFSNCFVIAALAAVLDSQKHRPSTSESKLSCFANALLRGCSDAYRLNAADLTRPARRPAGSKATLFCLSRFSSILVPPPPGLAPNEHWQTVPSPLPGLCVE